MIRLEHGLPEMGMLLFHAGDAGDMLTDTGVPSMFRKGHIG